jgi:hypothetical protein
MDQNISKALLNPSKDIWGDFFRNVGWGEGAPRGSMFQSVSPFAYKSYVNNAAEYLPSQFYANAFANMFNNGGAPSPNPTPVTPGPIGDRPTANGSGEGSGGPGGATPPTTFDPFGAEGLRAFLPQWAQSQNPNANMNLPGVRNQFNQALTNMSTAWDQYNTQSNALSNAQSHWQTIQGDFNKTLADYNGGVSTAGTLTAQAQAVLPIMQALEAQGLVTKTAVGTSGAATYKLADGAWNTNNILPKLGNVKTIYEQYYNADPGALDWMNNSATGQPNYQLAYSVLSGDTDKYYNSAVAKAGTIANAVSDSQNSDQSAYQKMMIQMVLNAMGQGWGGAFHSAYVTDLQDKINDYASMYSGNNQNFFQWLANIYNGYLR